MRFALALLLLCAAVVAHAQTTVTTTPGDADARLYPRTTQIIADQYAGTASIGAGDSVTVTVAGITVQDIAVVSYVGKVPTTEGGAALGWAIWTDGVLTVYGRNTYTATYLILRLR